MIVNDIFLSKLKDFGLNSYEAKLWTALLSRGNSTAGELSDIANVPRSRTYDVLESLEKKGFVIMKLGKPIKYLAVDPREVLKRVQSTIKKEADVKLELVSQLNDSEILSELNLLHNKGIEMVNPSDLSGSFKGRDASYEHLDTMFKDAEESIIILTTNEGLKREIPYFSKTLEKASKKGVDVIIVSDDITGVEKSDFYEIIEIPHFKARLIIVDAQEVMFMLMDDSMVHPTYDSSIWINSPFMAQSLKSMFEIAYNSVKTTVKKN